MCFNFRCGMHNSILSTNTTTQGIRSFKKYYNSFFRLISKEDIFGNEISRNEWGDFMFTWILLYEGTFVQILATTQSA
jgi:hypothetical protein